MTRVADVYSSAGMGIQPPFACCVRTRQGGSSGLTDWACSALTASCFIVPRVFRKCPNRAIEQGREVPYLPIQGADIFGVE